MSADEDRAAVAEAVDLSMLDVPDGSLLVFRVETRLLTELLGTERTAALTAELVGHAARLRDSLAEQGRHVSIMFTHPTVDLAAVDPEAMRELGWVRAGQE